MARLKRLIHEFKISPKNRSKLTLSDDTKLRQYTTNLSSYVTLKKVGFSFPTDTDLFFTTWDIEPQSVRQWQKLEILVEEDLFTGLLPDEFAVRVKIKKDAADYYYDGANWVVAGAGDWNTEDEVNTNLPSLNVFLGNSRKIAIKVNLSTTDGKLAPKVKGVKLLGLFEIAEFDSLVYESVINKIHNQFRTSSVIVGQVSGATSQLDLSQFILGERIGYNVTGIRSVYDLDNDPQLTNNLIDSYTPGSIDPKSGFNGLGIANLLSSLSAGTIFKVTFEYFPTFYVRKSQDAEELPEFPVCIFENVATVDRRSGVRAHSNFSTFIRDKANLEAVEVPAPKQTAVRFEWSFYSNLQIDQGNFVSDFNAFWENDPLLLEPNLDTYYTVVTGQEFDSVENDTRADDTDTNVGEGSFDILSVCFFGRTAKDEYLVAPGGLLVTTELAEDC